MSGHAVYEQLAVGFALASLEPADEQVFLDHLPSCAACERALVEHLETLSHLAYAAPDAAPPASLWRGIADRLPEVDDGAPAELSGSVPSLAAARERRLSRPSLSRRSGLITGVAAGIAVVVAIVVGSVSLQQQDPRTSASQRAVAEALKAMGEGPVDKVDLRGAGNKVQAVALMRGDDFQMVIDGLAANDKSRTTYVLWERSRMGEVRPLGTFDVPPNDPVVVKGMKLDHRTAALASLVITKEQGRTAPASTTQPALAAGELPPEHA